MRIYNMSTYTTDWWHSFLLQIIHPEHQLNLVTMVTLFKFNHCKSIRKTISYNSQSTNKERKADRMKVTNLEVMKWSNGRILWWKLAIWSHIILTIPLVKFKKKTFKSYIPSKTMPFWAAADFVVVVAADWPM